MTDLVDVSVTTLDLDALAEFEGRVVILVGSSGKLDQIARRVNRLTRGALERFVSSDAFERMKDGDCRDLAWPTGMAAEALCVAKLDRRIKGQDARRAGVSIGRGLRGRTSLLAVAPIRGLPDVLLGALLRAYEFSDHRGDADESPDAGTLTVMCSKPDDVTASLEGVMASASGVFFARDLVNEPANVLTTTEFADRLLQLKTLGVEVEVLEEDALEKLGMRTLLAVGQGSESPSKVVVMTWNGGGTEPPLALVGKGVVFDTGGISMKPAGGMEAMTMDMGGAGTVAGTMRTLALRKAKANVVGLVGLVENMPDGKATRPGDVVRSMKGDTVEIINTDAEGRLVLCDVLWYAQERFKPSGIVDLATLTGAVIIALGHENTGVFSNDDVFCNNFLAAAGSEGEGAWRLPLGEGYNRQLKSRIADMKNVGGRPAGSVTAAQFLQRFIQEDQPWIHLDIAGTASLGSEGPFSPKGATGWGVRALSRFVQDNFES